ncbi:MAG: YraN family protein [Bacteroidota bacterium]
MAEHNILGKEGEELAVGYLKEKGYKIRETNWTHVKEEIDIIAEKDDTLIIVEVKTRSGYYFGEPEEFVARKKQKHLIKAANAYIEENEIDLETRFDIISIIYSGKTYKINHLEDAFYPLL